MKKFVKYGLISFFTLILLAGITVAVFLDSALRSGTEKGINFATQTGTKLDKASLSLLSGNLKLAGLDIKNPEGFEAGSSFIKLGASEVQVKPASLLSDKLEVDVAAIDGLELSYIQPAEGKANYEVVLESINRLLPQADGSAPKEKAPPGNKAIHVGAIKFTNAKVHASVASVAGMTVPGGPVKLTVPLPNFEMDNVTVKDGMPELTAQMTKELIAQLVKQIPQIGKAALASAKENLKNIDVKGATDAVKGLGNLFKK